MLFTPFDPWKNKWCTCPEKYSLSAYTGCGHNCLYCYASSYIKNFYLPRPKKDIINRIKKEIKKIPEDSLITIANSSDPYLPLEKGLRLTRAVLEILKDYDLRLIIVTKSSLITEDFNLLKKFKKLVISFSITTLNKNLAKRLEPSAPLPSQRLKAIEKLSKITNVVCRLDPLIYPLNTKTKEIEIVIKELKNRGAKQIVTSTYKAKPDNFKRMLKVFAEHENIWNDLYLVKGKRTGRYIYLPAALRKTLIEEVREMSLKAGLDFSSCREGFGNLNTKNCDGSSFFENAD